MSKIVKHLVLLGLAIPGTLLGYHLVAGQAVADEELASNGTAFGSTVEALALGRPHKLSRLDLLNRDLLVVSQRYVELDRIDPEAMFQAALDDVERTVGDVMFMREPGGRRLQVTVGSHSTVLLIDSLTDIDVLVQQLGKVATFLDENLDPSVDRAEIEYTLLNGVLSTLDPHTSLIPPVAAREMDVDNEGKFGGLGIEIAAEEGRLIVKRPLENTPASRAGLLPDDRIVRIEGESTVNMDLEEAVSKLRGEVGTAVTIRVARDGFAEPRPFTLTRELIRVHKTDGQLLEGNVGYVRIPTFNAEVEADLDDLLARFRREAAGSGMQGLILDLRGNPGGYLLQAVAVSDTFLSDGDIVITEEGGTSGRRDVDRAKSSGTEPDYPIVVLVNGHSASASEIVAGALRNRKRAVIIGERTFGKGSVQHLFSHDDDSKLKLTVARYLTPGDHSIQAIGIPPDIELQPSVVRKDDDGTPFVSLYWRERIRREVDLEKSLSQLEDQLEEPAFSLRYLEPEVENQRSEPDPKSDWQVGFAREVLLASSGSRRAEVLQAAAGVVDRRKKAEEARIITAMSGAGLDWRDGSNEKVDLTASLDLGEDGVLHSGDTEAIGIVVTNHGEQPVYRLSLMAQTDFKPLQDREFYIGYLAPGESRRLGESVRLPVGYGEVTEDVQLVFRDPSRNELARSAVKVGTTGALLPRFAYSLELRDDGTGLSRGDGDGLAEVGETVDLVVKVTNVGQGPAREAFAKVKNRSGRALDLQVGSLNLGSPINAAGEPCVLDEDKGCEAPIAPGEQVEARFTFEVRSEPTTEGEPWKLEVQLGDSVAYDYGIVRRAGFFESFGQTETLSLWPSQALDGSERRPPQVQITRAPERLTGIDQAVISGIVEDARGIEQLMVFHGNDKIFLRGGGQDAQQVPFTVEHQLDQGLNTFVIMSRNAMGLTSTERVEVYYQPPVAQAAGESGEAG